MIGADRLSPIRAACERHDLAEVATRTGIHLPASSDHVNVACPFPSHHHPDRTPSLRLHLDTGRYHCFGCAAHGDVVQWVRDAEGLDVRAAIEVGHTPTGTDTLTRTLLADGFDPDTLVDAGLTLRPSDDDGRLIDAYRNRVLLPVRDPGGAVIALLGRHAGPPGPPKYLNPPRTAVYDKSRYLYQPLPPPAPGGHVIIVEGPLDALAIATVALTANLAHHYCPLTQSGRQLSAHQIRQVRHLDRQPVLAFDADPAGDQSTTRIGALLALAGCTPSIAHLPRGEDPASWLARHGVDGLTTFRPRAADIRLTPPVAVEDGPRRAIDI